MAEKATVLIESDWNLKHIILEEPFFDRDSINRIRLEFKGPIVILTFKHLRRINRIRLEFKACSTSGFRPCLSAY